MSIPLRIVPWLYGECSFYAVVYDETSLVDEFLDRLAGVDLDHADALLTFLHMAAREPYVREAYLRPERPELGIYAMYNHKELEQSVYNPSRLLCSYVGGSNRIMLLGPGFIKTKDEPIQRNASANSRAQFLANVTRMLNSRIDEGEVLIVGSELIPRHYDSLDF